MSAGISGRLDQRVDRVNFLLMVAESKMKLIRRNMVVPGKSEFDAAGSNVEKISGIIQDSDFSLLGTLKVPSLVNLGSYLDGVDRLSHSRLEMGDKMKNRK